VIWKGIREGREKTYTIREGEGTEDAGGAQVQTGHVMAGLGRLVLVFHGDHQTLLLL
jgi:hypothetical protein